MPTTMVLDRCLTCLRALHRTVVGRTGTTELTVVGEVACCCGTAVLRQGHHGPQIHYRDALCPDCCDRHPRIGVAGAPLGDRSGALLWVFLDLPLGTDDQGRA